MKTRFETSTRSCTSFWKSSCNTFPKSIEVGDISVFPGLVYTYVNTDRGRWRSGYSGSRSYS